jgi:phosphohistidine phosphatase
MPEFAETATMDLLLWRHGEAGDGDGELDRPLTERGERQARTMAAWLRKRLPKDLRIVASPSVSARQTAQALGASFATLRKIGPDACVSELIAASGWPSASAPVLIIGHQPGLGRLAALLLAGHEADWTIKKGALWWLSNRVRRGETQTVLRAVIPCELID